MRTVAALYVDPRGPYPMMPGVDCWDEDRDARAYPGPHPVVAHPPCGPWSRLRHFCRHQPRDCAPIAVEQVRRWGGVLEHPQCSTLWAHCNLPVPGGFPDELGGWSVEVDQVAYGHKAQKRTWLYVVGVSPLRVRFRSGGTPTHCVNSRKRGTHLLELSAAGRRRTPQPFADLLVDLARQSRRAGLWERVSKAHPDCAAMADRHYSRRTVGSTQFMPPGETIVLHMPGAVFGWWWRPHPASGIKAMNGLDGWTCTIFRNESTGILSSELILAAESFIGDCGPDGLITYVEDSKVRSINPGACFKAAGWRATGRSADGRKTLLQKPWTRKAFAA